MSLVPPIALTPISLSAFASWGDLTCVAALSSVVVLAVLASAAVGFLATFSHGSPLPFAER